MARIRVYSNGFGRHVLAVYVDDAQKMLEVEANGETMAIVRIDKRGDAVCYTPATEEDSRRHAE